MKRPRRLAKTITWGLLALASSLAMAQSPAGTTTDLAVNQAAATTCSAGEAVTLTGTMHFEYTVGQSSVTDPATGITTTYNNFQLNLTTDLTGAGATTKTKYIASTASSTSSSTTDSSAQFTVTLRYGLASQDAAPSLMLNQVVNVTVDTGGHISATLVSSSTDCVDQPSSGEAQ